MSLTTEQLDAAWYLAKERFANAPTEAVEQLVKKFPNLSAADAQQALARAKRLEGVCCDCVDEVRGPKNDWTGSTSRDYRSECPGFSDAVYQDAYAWAMYLTK